MSSNLPAQTAADSLLTGPIRDLLEEIRTAWLSRSGSSPHSEKLIQLALKRLERDLNSARRGEVIEQIRHEVEYREWCVRMAGAGIASATQQK